MNWLQKVPNSHRAASGLEWKLWRKLPWIAVLGTLGCRVVELRVHRCLLAERSQGLVPGAPA